VPEPKYLTVEHLSTKDLTRIFSKIKVNPETECWEWQGSITTSGYGRICLNTRLTTLHRLIFAWLIEPIPMGQGADIPCIDHLCRVRHCCNPAHLRLASPKENVLCGTNQAAINARKTHCKRGHTLPMPNKHGKRKCMVCNNESGKASRRKPETQIKYRDYQKQYQNANREQYRANEHHRYQTDPDFRRRKCEAARKARMRRKELRTGRN
jgi:hypothetical protein